MEIEMMSDALSSARSIHKDLHDHKTDYKVSLSIFLLEIVLDEFPPALAAKVAMIMFKHVFSYITGAPVEDIVIQAFVKDKQV